MRRQSIPVPALSAQDATDLFAYFYSARFFDRPGDAGRGKSAFERHRCARCHDIAAVAKWQSLSSPIALTEAMWNHADSMQAQFAQRGLSWPQLTSQELTDIFVYLSNHPAVPRKPVTLELKSTEGGEALLKEKGCLECHKDSLSLASRLQGRTLNDIAVAMWNHAPKMTQSVGKFQSGEMDTLLSYLWANQFFESSGSASHGRKVFAEKSCAGCHDAGKAPKLSGEFNTIRLTSALWSHGPAMLEQMRQQGTQWPRFTEREMADLIAFLDTTR
jgi:cytochrome c551/c552